MLNLRFRCSQLLLQPTTATAAVSQCHLLGNIPDLGEDIAQRFTAIDGRLSCLENGGDRGPVAGVRTMLSSDLSRRSTAHAYGTSAPGQLHLSHMTAPLRGIHTVVGFVLDVVSRTNAELVSQLRCRL